MLYLILLILLFPIPVFLFKSTKIDGKLIGEGNWNYVYEKDGKIYKVLKGLNDKNESMENLKINFYNKNWKPFIYVIVFLIAKHYIYRSHKIKKETLQDSPYFPKTYQLNDKLVQEKINKKNICNKTLKKQIINLNKTLEENNLILTDVHYQNIRMGKDGYIKIIDGEILYPWEFKLLNNINSFLTPKNIKMKKYKYGNNIIHWNIGEKSGEEKCSKFM